MEILLKILGYTCLAGLIFLFVPFFLYKLLESYDARSNPVPRTCQYCEYFQAGDVDARVNAYNCRKGHRLIAEEDKIIPHTTADGETMLVTSMGYSDGDGFGPPMLDRSDCPDWKRDTTGCSQIHSMEY